MADNQDLNTSPETSGKASKLKALILAAKAKIFKIEKEEDKLEAEIREKIDQTKAEKILEEIKGDKK